MKQIALTVLLFGIGIAGVAAQVDAIKTRQALMKQNDANGRLLSQMARGRVPFDAAKADAAFAQFAETAAKLPGLFPDNSKTGDTKASPKIWQNKSDFDAKATEFARVVAENRPKVKTLDGVKAALPVVGKACDNCHDQYRLN
ncbi:MAG: cytochrome c [Pseudomonadota bacterium]|nr:cytochrome c [Pseudomonadota bacterium]